MIDYSQRIPNNVNLSDDKALQRALSPPPFLLVANLRDSP